VKLKITVDGKAYEVDVEVAEEGAGGRAHVPYYAPPQPVTATPARPDATGARPARAPSGGGVAVAEEEKVCRSPLAGLVVGINTHPGQQIHRNDPLMVLEAMKMETNVTSPVAGVVKEVNAAVGDSVHVGQILVEFE
jgi:methylmalonyl-CoA carboxyltransferase small subunit